MRRGCREMGMPRGRSRFNGLSAQILAVIGNTPVRLHDIDPAFAAP